MQKISSFPPIINKDSKILILGSIPGVKSLEMQQYYAHPQNKFWKIICEIFNEDFTIDYTERIKILEKHYIALWDVIDSCERKGSLDSEIRNEEANKIEELLQNFPNIKAVFCNGQKSHKNLIKILGKNFRLPIVVLPSTSPAYAGLSYFEKLKSWFIILEKLQ
ncbi:DNA-deoxyinosine glycosylase [Cloacibacterium rupense]|uniref:DNA-deoxyinosine glycosylase n=1 Tax=Cloacibacterium rupense TaxID=517423 RepID=A0ABQ2NG22_9FLAO|nr:DNA-deoxyinosine glycosylase [Cloacibacterium rupense]GGP01598.1 DNA-deoxyinosine glycosylase [Cloacibacterium rupense]